MKRQLTNQELLELLSNVKNYIEDVEVTVDSEFGDCRNLKDIINEKDMPDIYNKVCEAIDKTI